MQSHFTAVHSVALVFIQSPVLIWPDTDTQEAMKRAEKKSNSSSKKSLLVDTSKGEPPLPGMRERSGSNDSMDSVMTVQVGRLGKGWRRARGWEWSGAIAFPHPSPPSPVALLERSTGRCQSEHCRLQTADSKVWKVGIRSRPRPRGAAARENQVTCRVRAPGLGGKAI